MPCKTHKSGFAAPTRGRLVGRAPRLAVLAAVLTCGACMPLGRGAQQAFATRLSCPPNRVVVMPRPDIPPHALLSPVSPPPEVALDPERLRYFSEVATQRAEKEDRYASVFEVSGCGVCKVLLCRHPLLAHVKVDIAHVDCEDIGECAWEGAPEGPVE
jgi:hypothetical protein